MDKEFGRQFQDIYKQSADAIFRYCLLRLSDRELARDLAQETFMKVWQYAQERGTIDNLKAFLFTTAKNLIIDQYRKKKTTSLEDMLERGFDIGVETYQGLIDRLDGEQALAVLNSIPEKYRDAIYMQYVEGLSVKEIASITAETENNISVRIHRGLQKMRSILGERDAASAVPEDEFRKQSKSDD